MKREIPLFLTAVIGAVMILGFFVPHPWVSVPTDFLQQSAVIVVAFGYVLGGANVLRVNLEGIAKRDRDWPYRVVLIAGMLVTMAVGFFVDGPRFQAPGTPSIWIYNNLFATMNATLYALLAFFIASAAFRAFRIRTLEAGLLAAAALIVMLGRVPLGDFLLRPLKPRRLAERHGAGPLQSLAPRMAIASLCEAMGKEWETRTRHPRSTARAWPSSPTARCEQCSGASSASRTWVRPRPWSCKG